MASTLRGIEEAELATWLSYHLDGCGFAKAFLFFDDPVELGAKQHVLEPWRDRVVAKPVDEQLQDLYKACTRYDLVRPRLVEDWLARQELHVELAMMWAQGVGCQWLLHIDLDELFLLGSGQSAPQHFGAVPPEAQATQYLNHEGVPELPEDEKVNEDGGPEGLGPEAERLRRNRFEAVTLFRRNPHCFASLPGLRDLVLSAQGLDLTKSRGSDWQRRLDQLARAGDEGGGANFRSPRARAARRALAFWPRRTRSALGSAQYFLAYASGKGAVRLGTGPPPSDVHRFGTVDLGHYWCPEEAAVLHYAHGGYEAVAEKLRRLRSSTGSWWRSFVFYERGRDMEDGALYDLYRRGVALCEPEEAARQVESGVCFRYSISEGHLPAWQLELLD